MPESHQGKHLGNTVNFRRIEIYCIDQLFLLDLMKGKVFIFKSKLNVGNYMRFVIIEVIIFSIIFSKIFKKEGKRLIGR